MRSVLLLIFLFLHTLASAQGAPETDILEADVDITVHPGEASIKGNVNYTFRPSAKSSTLSLNARNMEIHKVLLNGKLQEYTYASDTLFIPLKGSNKRKQQLSIQYLARPEDAVYFVPDPDAPQGIQVWTQGQGKYSSHWLPGFDKMEEKIIYDLTIRAPESYDVIANGELLDSRVTEGNKIWEFNMDKPMSSYLLAFAMGDFNMVERHSASGIPLQLYYTPEDSLKVDPTYRYTKEIFDFLEKEIGVPYPWGIYKQVPVKDFMYAGMENTTITLFSDRYMVDSVGFNDRNYVNVNAHEMAHQWFGNLVTEEGPQDHWLHEGFATYYALIAEKEVFGEDHFTWKLFDSARTLEEVSQNQGGEALIDPEAGSLTFYEKGAWALHELRQLVGDSNFREGMRQYLQTYRFSTATISDFISIMEAVSQQSLQSFREMWLESTEFPYQKAIARLGEDNESLACYLDLEKELMTDSGKSGEIIARHWDTCTSEYARAQMIRSHFRSMGEKLRLKVLGQEVPRIQRAIAEAVIRPEPLLFEHYESLLSSESYLAREQMLMKLWIHFPEQRVQILNKVKGDCGLPGKSLRQLWLTLALVTPAYEAGNKEAMLNELSSYTAEHFGQETRQTAFQLLYEIDQYALSNLEDLLEATDHHAWQFRKFAGNMLDSLLKKEKYIKMFKALLPQVPETQRSLLIKKLSKS